MTFSTIRQHWLTWVVITVAATAVLRLFRSDLEKTVQDLEAANEELKSSNEELVSMNEELQSANEELETSKEEMQSINEELQTVNAELNSKNEVLGRANSDLRNLLDSKDVYLGYTLADFQGNPTLMEFPAPGRTVRVNVIWTY